MMITIDHVPSREEFGKRMFLIGVWTPRNIKWYANDCPGCARAWERRLVDRGWIDLGPQWGKGRLAPIKRIWTYYGDQYDELIGEDPNPAYDHCCPEQLDQWDNEGLLFNPNCGLVVQPPQETNDFVEPTDDGYDYGDEWEDDFDDYDNWDDDDEDDYHKADWWKN